HGYNPAMGDVYDRLPKVEIHCHLEGTISPGTVAEFASKNGLKLPVSRIEDLYKYDSLNGFLKIFWFVQELLSKPEYWERAAYESIVNAAPHGLHYRETFFTPARHLSAGQDLEGIIEGITRGLEAAEDETGVRCQVICDMDRAYGAAAGLELVERLVELRRAGRAECVIGIGMDSTEFGVELRDYAAAFGLARSTGLRCTAHAGEDTGPDNIQTAIEALGAERIDHGLSILQDPELTARVAAQRIPLSVCPNSNVLIANKVPSLAEHPFRRMREAGLLATLNTDDPAMTDLDLGKEYRSVAEALEMSFDDMAAVALDGVEATWLDDDEKGRLRLDFEREIDVLRAELQ
ncbi:MAG TPA: adenosine deaminase, partial [Actinomycetota bacterium]|nr:adenosine deaminase [Actinomycetota bacterium]